MLSVAGFVIYPEKAHDIKNIKKIKSFKRILFNSK